MSESAIVSAAITEWTASGEPTPSLMDRLASVTIEALKRAKLRLRDIDAIIATTTALPFNDPSFITISAQHFAHRLASKIGSHGMKCINVCGACASTAIAFATADAMIKSGYMRTALVVGADNSPRGFYYQAPSILDADLATGYPHKVVGITNPSYWAMWARRRAYEMGKPVEDIKELMALVKVIHSEYGARNPYARYRKVFTVEEVLKSPVVCDPLHLYMIAATSSGAGAIVVADMERAKKLTDKPVKIAASAIGGPLSNEPAPRLVHFATAGGERAVKPFTEWRRTIEEAYKQAGITAEDVDIMEVHDTNCFNTINWIDQAMGWEREETDKLIRKGEIRHNGKLPVNLSGGTASFGEAVQCQALMMIRELFLQLRGEAGERQATKELKVGLCTAYGAYGSYGAIILERAW
jgi:acetyl-CoA acetyltransferase